jgi:hypothetical protein
MKKLLAVLLVLCSLLALASCGAKGSTPDTSTANKIVYGARYILEDDIGIPAEEQKYYTIYKDRLEHHYYSYSPDTGKIKHYTVTYKYTVMDEGTLAYFYHSDVIHDNDTANTKINTGACGLLLFSKDTLATTTGTLYIREDYAKNQLPNFGK